MQINVNGQLKNTQILLDSNEIQKRVQALAAEISTHYPQDETLIVLVVLNGALVFAADLIRHIQVATEIESIRLKSYIGDRSSGTVSLLSPLPQLLINQHVLIVEDIIDSGRSITFLKTKLKEHGVKSVRICTLLNKPEEHVVHVEADYVGFNIGKNFVVGYGLDLDGKYRNLPHIVEII
jgi:hypoxanthine phosphoribosyltransferase